MHIARRSAAVIVVAMSALLLSAALPTPGLTGPAHGTIQAIPGDITIENFAFVPKISYVEVGTTVRWSNADPVVHTVTSDTNLFASADIAPGGHYTHTFDTIGIFPYHCSIHTYMHGTVIVFQGPAQVFLPSILRQSTVP